MNCNWSIVFFGLILTITTPSPAGTGDFPLASCKGWNGTIERISGVNSRRAVMKGQITRADLLEYCERDPGGETKAYGGQLTVKQCIDHYYAQEKKVEILALADCESGALTLRYGKHPKQNVVFPLRKNADTSCASGLPPLIDQFALLCPESAIHGGKYTEAERIKLDSLSIKNTALNGQVREVELLLLAGERRTLVSGVLIDCNITFPQISYASKNWIVDDESANDQNTLNWPLKEIWETACKEKSE